MGWHFSGRYSHEQNCGAVNQGVLRCGLRETRAARIDTASLVALMIFRRQNLTLSRKFITCYLLAGAIPPSFGQRPSYTPALSITFKSGSVTARFVGLATIMDFRLDGSIFVGSLAHPKARKHNKPPLRLCRGGVFHCGIDRPVCEGHADIHCCNHCGIHAPASGSQN